ncbi:Zn-dependent hydrolase, partial [Candidatus Desantisbacteria bacterium]|nr:Zn-dependent hydrolase [Candidatus Desantisbacteria bacterium]
MDTVEWPEWIDDPREPPPPEKVNNGDLCIAYINQATVLIQMDKINILT